MVLDAEVLVETEEAVELPEEDSAVDLVGTVVAVAAPEEDLEVVAVDSETEVAVVVPEVALADEVALQMAAVDSGKRNL